MNPLQVRHVREALVRQFDGQIDLSDLDDKAPARHREQAFLSRALAAMAVQHLAGVGPTEAAAAVIDGFDDWGIDAVAVSDEVPHVWLVQAKWSDSGNASLDQASALKFKQGFDLLLREEYALFNKRFQALADRVDRAFSEGDIKITLVVALLGRPVLAEAVNFVVEQARKETEPMTDVKVMGLSDFHELVRAGVGEPKISLAARLDGFASVPEPFKAYYGTMYAGEVAAWYEEHGDRLFAKNIRTSLGLTSVNRSITETLVKRPDYFWYFNNGITVLCDSVRRTAKFANSAGGPGDFVLSGVSVVNGAQTVAAIHDAVRQAPDTASGGRVWVRLISLEGCPEGFATEVTQATNTQNQVKARDYAALDERQARLRDDFALSLHKTYVYKRGDVDPTADAGCSIVEAATALSCAHRNPELAMRAKQNQELLWEFGANGSYHLLFGPQPSAYRVWRSVLVLRAVLAHLVAGDGAREGRAAQVAEHGDLLIAHLVMQQVVNEPFDDRAADWDRVLTMVPALTDAALEWLIYHFDAEYPSSSALVTFKHPQKCRQLVELVLESVLSGRPRPDLPAEYSPAPKETERKAAAVAVIVNSGMVADGAAVEFRAVTGPERRALLPWIASDPRRGQATWVNDRRRPLLWAADGKQYSPTGLTMQMLKMAPGEPPKAVQGTTRWFVPGQGSLAAIADQIRAAEVD
ncbi:AIPR family protein [Micromonospora sp. C28SCA-DRY-2]|uniref:AIPR family protein n=1 Tax=Micromonospora sp. C28SCA-DRY-2 TaxID=3059522 RepID=UPI00267559E6|nr:AIPR family protein [Micromonospora sp. C28SCA-DRY-2]MDO3704715.1 AIPR family protein [Micromonospora sp. C28SCA-DRY-2]